MMDTRAKGVWMAIVVTMNGACLYPSLAAEQQEASTAVTLTHPLDAQTVAAAQARPIFCKVEGHSIQYFLSLPKDWSPSKKWPILVVITGSNSNFPIISKGYHSALGTLPFIIVTPTTVSSGSQISKERYPHLSTEELSQFSGASVPQKLAYDIEGLGRILQDVRTCAAGEAQSYLSGFSMGGTLAWQMAILHSEEMHAVFPVCAVYDPVAQADIPKGHTPANPFLPIYAFQGKQDGGIEHFDADWNRASTLARDLGFKNVARTITFRKHDWHYEEVIYFCHGHVLGRQAAATAVANKPDAGDGK